MKTEIVVPSCKPLEKLVPLREEIERTARIFDLHIISNVGMQSSQNRNLGLEACTHNYIVMIDGDMTGFEKGWNQELVAPLREDAKLGIVSGRLLKPGGGLGYMNSRNFDLVPDLVRVGKVPTAMIGLQSTKTTTMKKKRNRNN